MSYTSDIVTSMMNGLIEHKCAKGFSKLDNGLFEDILGQVYTLDIIQDIKRDNDGMEVRSLTVKFKPVDISGING